MEKSMQKYKVTFTNGDILTCTKHDWEPGSIVLYAIEHIENNPKFKSYRLQDGCLIEKLDQKVKK